MSRVCYQPLSRRELLRVGALTAFGLGLEALPPRRSATASPAAGRARNCILIWLDGGPSHLETFDVKPDAPSEVRGPLGTIATAVPGVRVSECLPRTAALLDRVALVRSLTSPLGEHNFGTHYVLSGYKPTPVLEYPAWASVFGHLRGAAGSLPAQVAVPDYRVGGSRFSGHGFLPASSGPFSIDADPARPGFSVRDLAPFGGLDASRLARRRRYAQLLAGDEGVSADLERAYQLVVSPEARGAFRLDDEPAGVRQRYGPRTVGQACLLARRLVERGVRMVTVNQRGWDTHADLYTRLKEGFTGAREPVGLIPTLDQALAALLEDLEQRGLLDETLVVVLGEFGRTPKLNTAGGRDHWPRVFSGLLAGGGVRGGVVVGASDRVGEQPAERPVTPADLARTIYSLLGIDPAATLPTADGRRVSLAAPESQLVSELLNG